MYFWHMDWRKRITDIRIVSLRLCTSFTWRPVWVKQSGRELSCSNQTYYVRIPVSSIVLNGNFWHMNHRYWCSENNADIKKPYFPKSKTTQACVLDVIQKVIMSPNPAFFVFYTWATSIRTMCIMCSSDCR